VPPYKFISILEDTGMILEVGRWVLQEAALDYSIWRGKGLEPPRVAVNVSPLQLRHKDFVGDVKRALNQASEVPALDLEITESLIMGDIGRNIMLLKELRDLGVSTAIDDFGTGYSSLSYIARLPVELLKIDRSFIINMAKSAEDVTIVSSIISLAHSLKLQVVAEGVETHEQVNLLKRLRCDAMQGYLFSPPVPAEKIEVLLEDQTDCLSAL
jgi:EAL domain-containing protein (putative c-di-GMP-specific phosphodiesterase class I)